MITVGSISRDSAAERFPFLATRCRGRRKAIKEFTHADPDFVFWIFPSGRLYDARDSHLRNTPRGYRHILDDEPDYCGFLRGRVATLPSAERETGGQLIVVYCREEALAESGPKLDQFLRGVEALPIAIREDALVISDNGDIYGMIADLYERC